MAGDTLRDAFRAELDNIIAAVAPLITWSQKDTLNTGLNPDASTGYFELEFPGGSESQFSFGQPGADMFEERGQVTLRAIAPLGRDRNLAESYALILRNQFRGRRFLAGGRQIRIDAVGSLDAGVIEAGLWASSIALGYIVYNIG
jgi:hypothetical protein